MSRIVPRTCTELQAGNASADASRRPADAGQPLERFRSTPAYVLLGDPGAGKTTAFQCECAALGDAAMYVTARDFLTFAPDDHPEWRGKTLFIDGLDECRAGTQDKRTPFDKIRRQLDKLGRPPFRLSCRTADWLGTNDRQHLASVTPQGSEVTVLRLDPLTDEDAKTVLAARPGITDPDAFISEAGARGLDGLLSNPQSLGLLASVVAQNGTWPQSRRQTFEEACRQLAAEHNQEHRAAGPPPEVEAALDAAGRLCAMLLITGGAGFTADPGHPDGDYLDPDECASDPCAPHDRYNRNALLQALSTQLFAAGTERRFIPIHRHLAEFLGARHLARLIADGLPARRVLALITGEDGGVVTVLRGLAAWLAALCKGARRDLIERDPIGVVVYGDVHDYTTDEKRTLLEALRPEAAARLENVAWAGAVVGSLVTPDLEPVLRNALKPPLDEPFFAAFVLSALMHGTPLPGLTDLLLELVYQRHRGVQLPSVALDAFLHNCPDQDRRDRTLERILADLNHGRLSDWNSELLGTALTALYPRRVTASEIWQCLPATNLQHRFGPGYSFWRHHLIERSSDSDIEALLDALVTRFSDIKPALRGLRMEGVPLMLLARGVERRGDTLDSARLCDWMGLDIKPTAPERNIAAVRRIGTWLEGRPHRLKEVIAETERRSADRAKTPRSLVDKIRYGAEFPPDYGLWCLRQAVTATSLPWIKYYLRQSCDALAHKIHDRGLTLELMFERTGDAPVVRRILEQEILVCGGVREILQDIQEQRNYQKNYRQERKRRHGEWIAYVRSNVAELRAGRGALHILYLIANAHYGLLSEVSGESPEKRIRKLFRGDDSLIEAAFSGIRGTINRSDLPGIDQIVELTGSDQEYRIGLPFQAALDLEPERRLNDRQARTALAFHYSTALRLRTQSPEWYRTLLARDPATVADMLVKCVAAGLRNGTQDSSLVYLLIEEDHAGVARLVVLPLLRRFPLRCTVPQLRILDYLLHAALRYVDRLRFQELIADRLSRASMTVAQRVHWLAMGVIVASDTYLEPLQELVQRREQRITHLVDFLATAGPEIEGLRAPALKYLIGLLGSTVGRWTARDSDSQLMPGSASSCVDQMIQRLAILPEPEAGAALDELASDTALSFWRATLDQAGDRRRVLRRDAGYRHPGAAQVGSTLRNGPPANPGDLAALITDRIDELAVRIRTANTNDWRQYWNVDPKNERPCGPKSENSCRDALLSDLRQILPPEVDAQPEGAYANDRRADVRISCGGFHVPVEAKRTSHRDLWSAIHRQLIEQYANDPATGGYGIYLVFWFETKDTPRPPGGGVPPDRPDVLREQLEALLAEDERRRISVRVIDVSAPPRCRQPPPAGRSVLGLPVLPSPRQGSLSGGVVQDAGA